MPTSRHEQTHADARAVCDIGFFNFAVMHIL